MSARFLMGPDCAFITGSDFLMDDGVTGAILVWRTGVSSIDGVFQGLWTEAKRRRKAKVTYADF